MGKVRLCDVTPRGHWLAPQLVLESRKRAEAALLEKIDATKKALEKMKTRVEEFSDYGELDMMAMYVSDVVKVQRRLQELSETAEWIHKVKSDLLT